MSIAAAAVSTLFTWQRVSGGVLTTLYRGPLIRGVQVLELAALTRGTVPVIRYRLIGYSAAAPWYASYSGTATPAFAGSPPAGSTGLIAITAFYAPSPYVEFQLLVSVGCWANLQMY